jgi:group I intron endonuclease
MKSIKYPEKAGIYKLTCKTSGKFYIGKSINIRDRIKRHEKSAKDLKNKCRIVKAIRKYGWDDFEVEILEIFEDFNREFDDAKLFLIESDYITKLNATDEKVGYNILTCNSGKNGMKHTDETKEKLRKANLGKKHSEETKKMMSEKFSGENHPMWGKHYTKEALVKKSGENSCWYGVKGESHPTYGRKHTPEAIKILKEKRQLQDTTPFKRKIKQINLENGECVKIWDSIKEAAMFFGVNPTSISEVCSKRKKGNSVTKRCKGYGWEYCDVKN